MKYLLILGLFCLPCFSQAQEVFYYGQGLEPLARQEGAATCSIIALPGGAHVKDCDGRVDYALRDHLSSVRVVIDSEGHFKKYCDYSPYGRSLMQDGGCRYTGHDYDADLALVRTPTRFYEPGIGRFISVDPARQGWTPYGYGRDNPALWLDPDGRSPRVGTLSDNLAIAGQPFFHQLLSLPSSTMIQAKYRMQGESIRGVEEGALLNILTKDILDSGLANKNNLENFSSYYDTFGRYLVDSYKARWFNSIQIGNKTYKISAHRYLKMIRELLYGHIIDSKINALRDDSFEYLSSEIQALLEDNGHTPTDLEVIRLTYQNQRYEDLVLDAGVANCAECSRGLWGSVARQHPGLMVETVMPSGIDHGFVIIGRDPNTDIRNPEGWNPEAVLADPWLGTIAPARNFYRRGYNPRYGYLFDREHGTNLSIDLTTPDGGELPRFFGEL